MSILENFLDIDSEQDPPFIEREHDGYPQKKEGGNDPSPLEEKSGDDLSLNRKEGGKISLLKKPETY